MSDLERRAYAALVENQDREILCLRRALRYIVSITPFNGDPYAMVEIQAGMLQNAESTLDAFPERKGERDDEIPF